MKVQTKIILIFLFIVAVSISGLLLWNHWELKRSQTFFNEILLNKQELFDNILKLQGSSLATFAYDYSYWDDLANFVATGDKTWAKTNLDPSLTVFKTDALWVYKTDFRLVYSVAGPTTGPLTELPLPAAGRARIFKAGYFCHFFVTTPAGLLEVQGAPIQPSKDTKRETPPQGYFFVGRLWGEEFRKELSALTNSEITIMPPGSPEDNLEKREAAGGGLVFARPLPGWDQAPVAVLWCHSRSEGFRELQDLTRHEFYLLFFLGSSLVSILFFTLRGWVSQPLLRISASLARDDPTILRKLQHDRSEFGNLARLVIAFFAQKLELIQEIGDRNQAESRLREQSEFSEGIIQTISEGLFVLDDHARYVLINPAAGRMVGHNPEEWIGKVAGLSIAAADRKRVALSFLQAMSGETSEFEINLGIEDDRRTVIIKLGPLNWMGKKHILGIVRDVTARRESEEKFRVLFESSRDAIMAVDETGFTDCNQATLELFGCAAKTDFIRKHPGELSPATQPDGSGSFAAAEERMKTALEQGTLFFPWTHQRLDGTAFPAEVLLSRYYLKGKTKVQAVVRDVTARAQAEEAMRKAENRYRALFNSSRDAIYVHDFAGKFIDANDAALRLFGYTREEVPALSFADLLSEDQIPLALATMQELLATGAQGRLIEFRVRKKDGTVIEAETMSVLIQEDGKPQAVMGVGRDVTERKALIAGLEQMGRQLEAEHAKLRSMIDNMEDVIVLIDENEIILDVNPRYESFHGVKRSEVVGRDFIAFVPEGQKDRARQDLDQLKSRKKNTINFNTKIGAQHMNVRNTAILGLHGSYKGAIITLVDITPLVEAQQRAEEANEAKSKFLANMSHEIRTPMNGILGFAELLEHSNLTEKQIRYVNTITQSGHHLLHLINQILDLSRIEAGKMTLTPAPFSPRALVREALEMVRPQAIKKGLALDSIISPAAPDQVIADERKLLQVLINLAGNAIKFTEQGAVEIKLDLAPPDSIVLAVKDSGPGIPLEQQARVFEAFEQVEGGLTRNYEGTGLGLAISSKLVRLMGGTIEVDSRPGRGSEFRVILPRGGEGARVEPKAPPITAVPRARPEFEPRREILVIDDEPQVKEVIKRMLSHLGFIGVSTAAADDALDLARDNPPAAVILDLNLPERSGWDILKELRRHPRTRDLPVIIGTVLDDPGQAEERGYQAWITKPFSLETLSNALAQAGLGPHGVRERLPAEITSAANEAPLPEKSVTILVVEDNPLNREVVKEFLAERTWTVLEAGDGQAGLDLMKARRPDLVLMDLAMPGLDGFTALGRMRQDPELAGVPVIALTAAAMSGDREKCLAAGFDDYLVKPFQQATLIRTMEKYLGRKDKKGDHNE